jgi:hypothetical protein
MDEINNILSPDILREISQEVTITQLDSLPTQELFTVQEGSDGRYAAVTPTTTADLERRKIERLPKSTRKQNCWAMSAYEDWAKWRNSQVNLLSLDCRCWEQCQNTIHKKLLLVIIDSILYLISFTLFSVYQSYGPFLQLVF